MASKGRSTGVKIERKPKTFYYLDGQGRVMEKAPGRNGGAAKFTGKRVPIEKGKFYFVDGKGEVRQTERKTGGGGRKKSARTDELLDEILGGR